MHFPVRFLSISAIVGIGILFPFPAEKARGQAEPPEEYREASPQLAREIEALIARLERADRYDHGDSSVRSFRNKSAEKLIEIGGPAVPLLARALSRKDLPDGARVNAMRVLGEIGVAKKADVVSQLCEFLESSVTDISYSDVEEDRPKAQDRLFREIEMCTDAADFLSEIGDPRALPHLLRAVEAIQEKANVYFEHDAVMAHQSQAERYAAHHARGVLQPAADATARISAQADRNAIEELTQSARVCVRVAAHLAKAKLMKKAAATSYLRKQIKTEENPKAKKKYSRFIDDVVSCWKEETASKE